jgi:hypothetical protein
LPSLSGVTYVVALSTTMEASSKSFYVFVLNFFFFISLFGVLVDSCNVAPCARVVMLVLVWFSKINWMIEFLSRLLKNRAVDDKSMLSIGSLFSK